MDNTIKFKYFNAIFIVAVLVFGFFITQPQPTKAASIAENVKGRILLQVEQNGEAWYVNPDTQLRYYMGRPKDAFELMRSQGLGISNEDIMTIPIGFQPLSGLDTDGDGLSDIFEDAIGSDKLKTDTDNDGFNDYTEVQNSYDLNSSSSTKLADDTSLINRLKGKILLQVEQNGEAWYLSPVDGKRYFLGRPADAFTVMRNLGLGITDNDLSKIDSIGVQELVSGDYEQFVLSKDEILAVFPILKLDINLSGEIKDFSELDNILNFKASEYGIDVIGGYLNYFLIDFNNKDLSMNESSASFFKNLPIVASMVIATKTIDGAKRFMDIEKNKRGELKENSINNLVNIGEEAFVEENVFAISYYFRIKNYIGSLVVFNLSSESNNFSSESNKIEDPFSDKSINNLLQLQVGKYKDYL